MAVGCSYIGSGLRVSHLSSFGIMDDLGLPAMIGKVYLEDDEYFEKCKEVNGLVLRELNGHVHIGKNRPILRPFCNKMNQKKLEEMAKKKLNDYKNIVTEVDKKMLHALSGCKKDHKNEYTKWINNEARLLRNLVCKKAREDRRGQRYVKKGSTVGEEYVDDGKNTRLFYSAGNKAVMVNLDSENPRFRDLENPRFRGSENPRIRDSENPRFCSEIPRIRES